eukprot:Tamp_23257.p1 GENE.Tamp_23257~~Tamp_23257.p1  ORF type:complete len:112 (-),score=1.48 Tamp_23257:127-462(-)
MLHLAKRDDSAVQAGAFFLVAPASSCCFQRYCGGSRRRLSGASTGSRSRDATRGKLHWRRERVEAEGDDSSNQPGQRLLGGKLGSGTQSVGRRPTLRGLEESAIQTNLAHA